MVGDGPPAATPRGSQHCSASDRPQTEVREHLIHDTSSYWVTLSFRNTKVLHQSVTPNLKFNC